MNNATAIEERASHIRSQLAAVKAEIGKAIVGHEQVVEDVLVCLLCSGHALIEGVPGLGKTYLIRTLGDVLHLDTSRIQFTPDLLPADLVGTRIIQRSVSKDGKTYFSLAIYSLNEAQKLASQAVAQVKNQYRGNEEALFNEFKARQAFKELDAETVSSKMNPQVGSGD